MRRFFMVCALIFGLTPSGHAQWGLTWDVQIEDDALRAEILGHLQVAGSFYENLGFPAPYFTDSECRRQNPVEIINVPAMFEDEPWALDDVDARCGTSPLRYCRESITPSCRPARLTVVEEFLLTADPEVRKTQLAGVLFGAVMEGYDWYRENRPQLEPWFTHAMVNAAVKWWIGSLGKLNNTEIAYLRAYNYPLHAPLGKTRSSFPHMERTRDLVRGRERGIWAREGLMTSNLWEMMALAKIERPHFDRILAAGLRADWTFGDGSLFFLDLLDIGLHDYLISKCLAGTVADGKRARCQSLCGRRTDVTIRYLDVQKEQKYAVCDDRVGGLYYWWPILMNLNVLAAQNFDIPQALDRYFRHHPDRTQPDGCIKTRVGSTLELSIPPVAAECIMLSGLPRESGSVATVWLESTEPELLDQVHLGWEGCVYPREILDFGDGTWAAFWNVDRSAAFLPKCVRDGPEIPLVFANVATRAAETEPIKNLTLHIYAPFEGEAE